MKKKLLSLLLAATLCLAGLPLSAAARADSAYTDVKPTSWYAYAVQWASQQQVVSGTGDGAFSPASPVTRAQLVQMLWKLAGSPEASPQPFTDVDPARWYAGAVNWAGENRIAVGFPDGSFGVKLPATREQVVTILRNFAALRGEDLTPTTDLTPYADAAQLSSYAREPMGWAVAVGILSGTTPTTLAPRATATRAQVVSMLYHWLAEYTLRDVHLYRDSLEEYETVTLRFYRDQPHVPTLGLAEYYNLFWRVKTTAGPMTVSRDGETTVFTAPNNATAVVDPAAQTCRIPDYQAFIDLPLSFAPLDPADDPVPFILGQSSSSHGNAALTLRLAQYGIPVRAEAEDVYFPLATLNDLFNSAISYYPLYNGNAIYLRDAIGNVDEHLVGQSAADYYSFVNTPRGQDLIDFSYRETLLLLETFFGRPVSCPLSEVIAARQTDRVLQEDYPEVYRALHDPNLIVYGLGLFMLYDSLLQDGGHTGYYDADWSGVSYLQAMADAAAQLGYPYQERALAAHRDREELAQWHDQAFQGEAVIKHGDTLFFSLPSFTLNLQGWKEYYAALRRGEHPQRPGGDALCDFLDAVELARADPQIRHFVLDLSLNGGGAVQVGAFLADLMTGDNQMNWLDESTGLYTTVRYRFDRDLDGQLTPQDEEFCDDLNFAVLASGYSFSCANTVAALLWDAGVPVLGERTGGGSCTVQENPTPEGLVVRLSSSQKLCDKNWADLDVGVEPDVSLVATDAQGRRDHSGFYDLDRISRILDDLFS